MADPKARRLYVLALEQHRTRTPNGGTPSARASTVEPDGSVTLRDADGYMLARLGREELSP